MNNYKEKQSKKIIPVCLKKKIDIKLTACPFCGLEHETWGYEGLVSKFDGKLIRYSNHSCPKLKDVDAENKKIQTLKLKVDRRE